MVERAQKKRGSAIKKGLKGIFFSSTGKNSTEALGITWSFRVGCGVLFLDDELIFFFFLVVCIIVQGEGGLGKNFNGQNMTF